MLVIRRSQLDDLVLADRRLLIRDIEDHLRVVRPEIVTAYPRPYLRWVIGDSIDIARGFGLDDVPVLRAFVRLRWDIAPGFYKQPALARVLSDPTLHPAKRLEALATEAFAGAWNDAERFDAAEEWRARFWLDEP